jgi:methylmalonyl-CoA decarboxylase
MSLILTSTEGLIGTITLNNPKKRNCLSHELLQEMIDAFDSFIKQEIRIVILRANGKEVWSAGFDIDQLPEPGRNPISYEDLLEQAMRKIQKFPGLVIAMVGRADGGVSSVYGGASEVACICDITVGIEEALFRMTPVKLGVPYNIIGIVHLINRVGYNVARRMMLTAELVNSEGALKVGLLDYCVNSKEVEEFTYNLARENLNNSLVTVAVTKEIFNILGEAYSIPPSGYGRVEALRRLVYDSPDYPEGRAAFKEKRKPNFLQGEEFDRLMQKMRSI